MNILETEWWTMVVPPEWWAEAEEDSILVGDQDEVGCIEISTLHKADGEFSEDEVLALARSESESGQLWSTLARGDFEGCVASALEDDGVAIREWYLAHGTLLLFVTYSCDAENRGMDDAAVDEILDTLQILDAPLS